MKNFKLLLILFLGVGLTFASCNKDDDDDGGESPAPVVKTCYVVKETADDDTYREMTYNSDYLITNYNSYAADGTLEENNKITYTDGKVSLIETFEGTSLKAKMEIVYASDHIDSAILYMDTLGVMKRIGFYTYTYSGDKLSSMSMYFEFFGQMLEISKSQFIYNADNVITKTMYELGGSFTLELSATYTYEYDDKINPYLNIGMNNVIDDVIFMSKNNATKITITDDSGNVDNEESFENTYEYNSDNYYTKFVKTSFDNTVSKTYTVDYECR